VLNGEGVGRWRHRFVSTKYKIIYFADVDVLDLYGMKGILVPTNCSTRICDKKERPNIHNIRGLHYDPDAWWVGL
jgi:hypothetical protein